MSTNSQLSYDKQFWLNTILDNSLQKEYNDFDMIDDYVYHLVREFVEIDTPGKVYTWGSGGMGHIIVVKRDDVNSPYFWSMFETNYKPLDEDDEYIEGYTSVFKTILEKRRQAAKDNIAQTPFSLTGSAPPPGAPNYISPASAGMLYNYDQFADGVQNTYSLEPGFDINGLD